MPVKSVRTSLQQFPWNHWESEQPRFSSDGEIPTVDVQKHREVLSQYASWSADYSTVVPTYTAITAAGDAMWVPTWTWHRVD
jgi:hypothetical protein